MSEVYASMPVLEIPPNTRETILPKRIMFWVSLRMSLLSWLLSALLALECIFFCIVYFYGVREFYQYTPTEFWSVIAGVCLFYALIVLGNIAGNMRKMNLYGVPLVFGYTREYIYGASVYHQGFYRWEYHTAWKEMKGFFLLNMQGQWGVLPKSIWTEEEQEELRIIMRGKVGKPFVPSPLR